MRSVPATCWLVAPRLDSRMMRARSANACPIVWRRADRVSVSRSSSLTTSVAVRRPRVAVGRLHPRSNGKLKDISRHFRGRTRVRAMPTSAQIDDIGLLPAGQDAAEAFCRVVDAAYERRSAAVTSNLHRAGSDAIMPKPLATGAVDCLLRRAHLVLTRAPPTASRRPRPAAECSPWPDPTRSSGGRPPGVSMATHREVFATVDKPSALVAPAEGRAVADLERLGRLADILALGEQPLPIPQLPADLLGRVLPALHGSSWPGRPWWNPHTTRPGSGGRVTGRGRGAGVGLRGASSVAAAIILPNPWWSAATSRDPPSRERRPPMPGDTHHDHLRAGTLPRLVGLPERDAEADHPDVGEGLSTFDAVDPRQAPARGGRPASQPRTKPFLSGSRDLDRAPPGPTSSRPPSPAGPIGGPMRDGTPSGSGSPTA